MTTDFNYIDLVWHELEFRDRDSFTYVLRDDLSGYLGCCYLYPLGRRQELTEELLDCDVDVSWWVTPGAFDDGFYAMAYDALQRWLEDQFPFWTPHFSNGLIPEWRSREG